MKRQFILTLIVAVSTVAMSFTMLASEKIVWTEYVNTTAKVSQSFPSEFRKSAESESSRATYGAKAKLGDAIFGNLVVVYISELPSGESPVNVIEKFAKGTGATVVSRKVVKSKAGNGLEGLLDNSKTGQETKVRCFVVGKSVYMTTVTYPTSQPADAKVVDKFFKSLKIN